MKKLTVFLIVLAMSGAAFSAIGDVSPVGLTGLWRFQDSTNKLAATIGTNLTTSHTENSAWMTGPWTAMGTQAQPGLFSDNGVVQERAWDYLTVYHGMSSNGGGSFINEYTVAIDYCQTNFLTSWNSLFQTAWNGNGNDGDLFTNGQGRIGVGAVGYSTLTYDVSTWHRIVWSVDNGSFFRVYVDGVLFLDGPGQSVDGRFALELDRFHLFADESWEDQWGLVGTVATWNRALTSAEVADMGGWIGGAANPTALILIPEPATLAILALGGLLLRKSK